MLPKENVVSLRRRTTKEQLMKRGHSLILLMIIFVPAMMLLTSCGEDKEASNDFSRAEHLMEADSANQAFELLQEMEPKAAALPRAQRMRYHLLQAKAQNKAAIDFTTDSVMKSVAAYYDRHGTHNDRLLAHYLLGCVYRDLGEAPRAIGCYLDAVDYADTLSSSCDFKTLSCVYSQMADMFTLQLALSDAIDSRNKSIHISLQIQDTLNALYDMTQVAGEYLMLSQNDTAEAIFMKAKAMYMEHGYIREWAVASLPLAYIYLSQPQQLDKAKKVLDLYDAESEMFTSDGNLPPSECMYFFNQGHYQEAIGHLDSAEYFYRKMFYPNMHYTYQSSMCRGLLNVYKQKNSLDSIYKYTLLYCQANDSSVVAKDRDLIMQMKAAYSYNRMQKEALHQTKKAARAHVWLIFFIFLAIILTMSFVWLRTIYNRRRRQKQEELERVRLELAEAEAAYDKEKHKLDIVKNTHQKVIRLIQGDVRSSKEEAKQMRAKYNEIQHRMNEINALYEENIKRHNEEMESAKAKIEDLRQKAGIDESIEAAQAFRETSIVKRILFLDSKSRYELSENEWGTLVREFSSYYPTLLSDLHQIPTLNEKGIRVGILVVLKLRESAIAHFIGIGDSAVSNYKSDINHALFKEKSSRSLFNNLKRKYGIFL